MTEARYFNRELSWLAFNRRVLEQAQDVEVPLLERLKFLAITGNNLDEFFMVRVGGLKILEEEGVAHCDAAGFSVGEQLVRIRRDIEALVAAQDVCFSDVLEPEMREAGLIRRGVAELSTGQFDYVQSLVERELFAVLTPQEVGVDRAFPLLTNLHLHLLVRFCDGVDGVDRFAVIPLGSKMQRMYALPSRERLEYMLIEDVLEATGGLFFPGLDVLEMIPFRITRNGDMELQEDAASDLLLDMQRVVDARRTSECVRLELAREASPETVVFLMQVLNLGEEDVFLCRGAVGYTDFMGLACSSGFDELQFEAWAMQSSPDVAENEGLFDAMARGDVMLHHPYESFDPVIRFVREATEDADVLAIKQTLYRTSPSSPIVGALIRAAQLGKSVTALVELKARFDEQRNIDWARSMEVAGVQVIYGVRGFKTHAKVCMVVRREPDGIRRYMHFGTGNYNEKTASIYGDISLFTRDWDLGSDAAHFFNTITGVSELSHYRKLEMAPTGLRDRLLELIAVEVEMVKQGRRGHIQAKLNSLVDPRIIDALYVASQAGVEIELNVRGICTLRPGVVGMSEGIRVVSIVDRYLEHSRIIHFNHGDDPLVFISSADWMSRNLDKRLELLVPIEDVEIRSRLLGYLAVYFEDNQQAWELQSDGTYRRLSPGAGLPAVHSQYVLWRAALKRTEDVALQKRTMFEPYRAGDISE